MESRNADDKYTIRSVENALDLLDVLSESDEEVRIVQIGERLHLGQDKVFRILATLERRGYVEREKPGVYRVGAAAFEMAQKLLTRFTLLRKAKPVMEALARSCGEAVYLAIPRGDEILLVDMIDTLERIKVVPLLGRRYPLTETNALGQVISSEIDSTVRVDREGLGVGIACLAAPLRNARGKICGAISLVGPDFRFARERIEQLVPALLDAAEEISSKIGFMGRYTPLS